MPANRKSETTSSGNSAIKEHRDGRHWRRTEDGRKQLFSFKAKNGGCLYADHNNSGETGRSLMIPRGAILEKSSEKVGSGAQN